MSLEAIGAELATRLAARTVAQGAETDLGLRVFRGKRRVDDAQMPCSVVIEGSSSPIDDLNRAGEVLHSMDIALHAYVPCDPDNPNVAAHAALRDLKRAVWPLVTTEPRRIDTNLGRLASKLSFQGQDIAPRADGAGFVLAVLQISVEVSEDLTK